MFVIVFLRWSVSQTELSVESFFVISGIKITLLHPETALGHGGTVTPGHLSPPGLWRRKSLKTAKSPSQASSRLEKGLSFCNRDSHF